MPSYTIYTGSSTGAVETSTVDVPALKGDELLIRITASGLCGTDLHYRKSPSCLGHEGAGVVEETGPGASRFKKGDRVGFGYVRNACGTCQHCLEGNDIFCEQRELYGMPAKVGSLASHAVWREAFAYALPDGISDEDAAPLMCGGATVFNALSLYEVKSTERVGIVGIGGLGHLAIQFASKMGCEVTVFSGTDAKKDEALALGAHHFVATKGVDKIDLQGRKKIDRLLVTTSAQPDWSLYAPIMAPLATIFIMGVSGGNFTFPYIPIIMSGLRLQGSLVASRRTQNLMFEFAARHQIKPIIQKYRLDQEGIEKAMEDLNAGSMRYRGVLVPNL